MIRVLAFVLLAGALAGVAAWVYLRAELPVARAGRLAALRGAALILLAALVLDVRLPWAGGAHSPPRWALLDVSASMGAGDGGAWDRALARARALEAEGWTVVPFGAGIAATDPLGSAPAAPSTELAPALARAVEAGAAQVRVLSDLRFHDPVASASALAVARLDVTFEDLGAPAVNAGVSSFAVEDQPRRGEPTTARVEYFASGVADSLVAEVREEGTVVAVRALAPPAEGRLGRAEVPLPPPRAEGRVRYTVRLLVPGDAFPSDDHGVAYMAAGREEAALVVVSLRPDWEPRALLPVLGEATGLRAVGYLRAGSDRFVPMGGALERGAPVDSATVGRAARSAALLVVHGADARADAFARSLAELGGRVLLWPADASGAEASGFGVTGPLPGEWYLAEDGGASPLAGDLAGVPVRDLPPLSGLLAWDAGGGGRAAAMVRPGGTGEPHPAVVLDASGGARRALVLASGFRRWAARGGEPREAYRRLWAGVAGWLLAGSAEAPAGEVRPQGFVVAGALPVAWRVPGADGAPVRLQVTDSAGSIVADTLLTPGSPAVTRGLPPGTYAYRASRGDAPAGAGRFDVEARTDELLPRRGAPEAVRAPGAPPTGAAPAGGSPLRTRAWPYLLILALLSAEWVGRRRAGLR